MCSLRETCCSSNKKNGCRALPVRCFGLHVSQQGRVGAALVALCWCLNSIHAPSFGVHCGRVIPTPNIHLSCHGLAPCGATMTTRGPLLCLSLHPPQIHGGAGVSQDTVLAHLFAASRTLRIADGPDEVHLGTLAKLELEAAAGGPQQLKQRLAASTRPKL